MSASVGRLDGRAGGDGSMRREGKATEKVTPAFEPSEFYEKLLRERETDPARFDLTYSQPTRAALQAYLRAKNATAKEADLRK